MVNKELEKLNLIRPDEDKKNRSARHKRLYKAGAAVSFLICAAASAAEYLSLLPDWICAAIVILSFTAFVMTAAMCLTASENEEDYPFVGY